MAKVFSYCADEDDLHIFQKSKNHVALFAVSVRLSDQIRSIQYKPHILQIDIAFFQDFFALDRVEANSANALKLSPDPGSCHCLFSNEYTNVYTEIKFH